MSLIKTLRLLRVDASFSANDPLQWSENCQLALNGYNQITLLEPKLPSLHQAIKNVNNVNVLDPKDLFQVMSILDSDSIKSFPLGHFNHVAVVSGDEPFNIANITDYIIVSHQWTGNSDTSRDNLLGVLFNSGEFLVIGRKNTQSNKYFMYVDMFEVLCEQFGVDANIDVVEKEKYEVDSNQLFALKVKCFHFSNIGSELLVSIVNGNNTLLIYKIHCETYKLKLLASIDNGFRVIKQKWSNWNDSTSFITVVSPENSLHTFKLEYQDDQLSISQPILALQPSRFKVSQFEYVYYKDKSLLVTTLTGKLIIIDQDQTFEYPIDNFTTCVSIVNGIIATSLTIILSFENGTFTTIKFDLDNNTFESTPTDNALASFVDTVLSIYQLDNMENEDDEESESGNEGLFVLQGIKKFSNNVLALQYKTIPKNALVYRIQSQLESQLQFIKLETGIDEPKQESSNKTSIARIVQYWIENFTIIPQISDNSQQDRNERIDKFIDDIEVFKKEQVKEMELTVDTEFSSNFSTMLLEKFNHNPNVNQLQYQHTLIKLLINSLIVFREENDKLNSCLERCKLQLTQIEQKIGIYLKQLIFKYVKDNNVELINEFDKYLMISNFQRLRDLGIKFSPNIPEKCTFTIGTKFYSETFEVHIDDPLRKDKLICTINDHGWTMCTLSNLPLLQMNNRRDELSQFHYIIPDKKFGKGLVTDLLYTINYCYISGNKTYQLK